MSDPISGIPKSRQNSAKFQYFPTGDQKDYVQKELDQLQAIISRMAANSFQCKGWAIGIVSIIIAIGKDSFMLSGYKVLVLLVPILVFWYLDAFFLYTEQMYRDLFNDVVKKRFNAAEGSSSSDWSGLFNYNYTDFEDYRVSQKNIFVHLGYSFCFDPKIIKRDSQRLVDIHEKNSPEWITAKNKIKVDAANAFSPKPIPTYFRSMVSKTLWPLYLVPLLFVVFAFLQGQFAIFGEAKVEKKEPVTIQIDATTLQPLLDALKKTGATTMPPTPAPQSTVTPPSDTHKPNPANGQ